MTPLSVDRAEFGLPAEDAACEAVGWQAPCEDCREWADPALGCYAPPELPANWREVEPFASQACATQGCTCWGGQDRECEDCWLSLK